MRRLLWWLRSSAEAQGTRWGSVPLRSIWERVTISGVSRSDDSACSVLRARTRGVPSHSAMRSRKGRARGRPSTIVLLSATLASILGSGAVLFRAGVLSPLETVSASSASSSTQSSSSKLYQASSLSPARDAGDALALDPQRLQLISEESPRAVLARGILSEAEAEHLRQEALPRLQRSGVVDTQTGESVQSSIRTSSGAFLPHKLSLTAERIERKIHLLTMTPPEHGESLQVLRYEPTQEYKPHLDYFHHESAKKNNRLVTALMYLGNVDRGGETVFPVAPAPESQKASASNYTACGMRGLSVRPNKGDVLVFWSMKPGGEVDPASKHGSCPVEVGEKWTATRWIHVGKAGLPDAKHRVHREDPRQPTQDCEDENNNCEDWANSGECSKNPGYMLQHCRFSCRQCVGIYPD